MCYANSLITEENPTSQMMAGSAAKSAKLIFFKHSWVFLALLGSSKLTPLRDVSPSKDKEVCRRVRSSAASPILKINSSFSSVQCGTVDTLLLRTDGSSFLVSRTLQIWLAAPSRTKSTSLASQKDVDRIASVYSTILAPPPSPTSPHRKSSYTGK